MPVICSNSHENSDGAAFCSTCGVALGSEEASKKEVEGGALQTQETRSAVGSSLVQARWFKPAVIGLAALLVLGVGVGIAIASANASAEAERQEVAAKEADEAAKAEEERLNQLPNAAKRCTELWEETVGDDGLSLILDLEGEDYGSGDLSFFDLECILEQLNVTDVVFNSMLETRSLDGRQSGEWGDFKASWSYHPDDGLDVIVELIG